MVKTANKGRGKMLTVIGFVLVGIAFLDIANNRQLARYLGGSSGPFRTTAVRQGIVLAGMAVFFAGVAVIVLSNV
jgi:hypothetical protein